MQNNAPSGHTGAQEPDGQGHRTRKATHRAGTPLNTSHVAEDTAKVKQRTHRTHWCTGPRWPRIQQTQQNKPHRHTGEQKPNGPGHRSSKTTHRAGAPVNRSQEAQDTAHTCTCRAAEGQERTNRPWVGRTGATQPTHRASSRGGPPRQLVRARPGRIGDHGTRHPEPWKQPLTGKPAHSPGGSRLPIREAPQLKPQG